MSIDLNEIIPQDAKPQMKAGIELWSYHLNRFGIQARNAFSWYLDFNFTKIEWISLKFYHKVPYYKRKNGIDFWGYNLNCVGSIGQRKMARNKHFYIVWTITWLEVYASLWILYCKVLYNKKKDVIDYGGCNLNCVESKGQKQALSWCLDNYFTIS